MQARACGHSDSNVLTLAKRNFALYVAALNVSTRQALCAVAEMFRI